MSDNNQAIAETLDYYDCVADGISQFACILVIVSTRVALSSVIRGPISDNIVKMILRESGSTAIAMAAGGMTGALVRTGLGAVKKYIVK